MPQKKSSRSEVRVVLESIRSRNDASAADRLTSMEVVWAISELERRFDTRLSLGEKQLDRILTADDVVDVLYDMLTDGLANGRDSGERD